MKNNKGFVLLPILIIAGLLVAVAAFYFRSSSFHLNKNSIVGVWQDGPVLGSGWGDRYQFYSSGAYAFIPSQGDCDKRTLAEAGTYNLEGNTLTLTKKVQIMAVGGTLVPASASCAPGQDLEDFKVENQILENEEPSVIAVRIGEIDPEDPGKKPSIFLNYVAYWKFYDSLEAPDLIPFEGFDDKNCNDIALPCFSQAGVTPHYSCKTNKDLTTETCTVTGVGGVGFSFEHPKSFPILTSDESWDRRGEQLMTIYVYDPSRSYEGITKEQLTDFKLQLERGSTNLKKPATSPFSRWTGDAEMQTLSNGSFARISTTFGAFEVCDRQFSRRIEFVSNEKIYVISIEGDVNKIYEELPPKYLTYESADQCNGDARSTTGSLEALAGSSTAAKAWVETSNQVLQTLKFTAEAL